MLTEEKVQRFASAFLEASFTRLTPEYAKTLMSQEQAEALVRLIAKVFTEMRESEQWDN